MLIDKKKFSIWWGLIWNSAVLARKPTSVAIFTKYLCRFPLLSFRFILYLFQVLRREARLGWCLRRIVFCRIAHVLQHCNSCWNYLLDGGRNHDRRVPFFLHVANYILPMPDLLYCISLRCNNYGWCRDYISISV